MKSIVPSHSPFCILLAAQLCQFPPLKFSWAGDGNVLESIVLIATHPVKVLFTSALYTLKFYVVCILPQFWRVVNLFLGIFPQSPRHLSCFKVFLPVPSGDSVCLKEELRVCPKSKLPRDYSLKLEHPPSRIKFKLLHLARFLMSSSNVSLFLSALTFSYNCFIFWP